MPEQICEIGASIWF